MANASPGVNYTVRAMLEDCWTPVVALMATTETWESPVGVGTGGGVLLLLQPNKSGGTEAEQEERDHQRDFSRKLRRRRRRNRENGSSDASVRTAAGWR